MTLIIIETFIIEKKRKKARSETHRSFCYEMFLHHAAGERVKILFFSKKEYLYCYKLSQCVETLKNFFHAGFEDRSLHFATTPEHLTYDLFFVTLSNFERWTRKIQEIVTFSTNVQSSTNWREKSCIEFRGLVVKGEGSIFESVADSVVKKICPRFYTPRQFVGFSRRKVSSFCAIFYAT